MQILQLLSFKTSKSNFIKYEARTIKIIKPTRFYGQIRLLARAGIEANYRVVPKA